MADNLITRFVNVCQYLQDPHHVARFQEICGVRETFSGNSDVKSEVERERLLNNGSCTNHQHRAGTENCKVNRSGEGDQTESLRQRTNNLAECNLKRDENNSSPLNSADESQGFGEIEESKAKVTCSNFTGVREDGVERRETPSMYSSTSNGSTPAEMTVDALGNNTFLGGTTVKPLRKNSLTGEAGQAFLIENKFLYYLFTFGTELGNEPFYITFFPFIMWNVDAYVSRRLILVWVWVMYIGQCTKDVIRRSRPASPPVIKVEMFYNSEYSLPSTHAMSGTAIPLSLLFLTYGRWEYPLLLGVTIAMSWSVLVCVSRIYMGMHSILDIIVGFLYSLLILLVFGPVFERMDTFNQSHPYAPLLIVPLHLAMGLLSFTLDAWSTSRADTAQILGTGAGAALATCLNGRLGMPLDLPASALPLRAPGLGRVLAPAARALLRFGVGSLLLLATRAVMKALTIPLACRLAGVPSTDIRKARQHTAVELPYRYLVYGTVGFSALFIVPYLFYFVGLF